VSVDLAAATSAGVLVLTPDQWAGDGDAYTVKGASRATPTTPPTVASVTPNTIKAGKPPTGGAPFTLHVTGTKFVHGDRVSFGGATPPTSYVSDTELTVPVDPSHWQAGQVGVMVAYSTRGPSGSVPFTFT
jgi:hypothetical protein